MELRNAGRRGRLAEVAGVEEALHLARWAREHDVGAEEIVPAACTVLFDGLAQPDALAETLASWRFAREGAVGESVTLEMDYDGEDLAWLARAWGTDEDGVVERHQGIEFVSAFCGFAPGFAYLSGLPEELAVSRMDSPRAVVPAGSVALAGSWCGVYPTASPGGWRLLGHTDEILWDPARDQPATLAPGTRVRFTAR